jgi:hypothetical protein
MIVFIGTYLQLRSIITVIANGFLRLAPFLAGLQVSPLPLWRMSNEDSLPNEFCWAFSRVLPSQLLENRIQITISNSSRYCVVILCKGNVCCNLLHSNDSFVAIRCSGNVITEPLLSNGRLLWLHYSGLQAVLTEPLPSHGSFRYNMYVPTFQSHKPSPSSTLKKTVSPQHWCLLHYTASHSRWSQL